MLKMSIFWHHLFRFYCPFLWLKDDYAFVLFTLDTSECMYICSSFKGLICKNFPLLILSSFFNYIYIYKYMFYEPPSVHCQLIKVQLSKFIIGRLEDSEAEKFCWKCEESP